MSELTDLLAVEWDPTIGADGTPDYVALGDIHTIRIAIGRTGGEVDSPYPPGSLSMTVDNTDATIDPTVWHRQHPIRVTTIAGVITGGATLFAGAVTEVSHDQSDMPFTAEATIGATDSLASEVLIDPTSFGGVFQPGSVPVSIRPDEEMTSAELIARVAVVECGALIAGEFRARYWLLEKLAAGPVLSFTDVDGAGEHLLQGTFSLAEFGGNYADTVTYQGDSGIKKTAADVPATYLPVTFSRLDQPCPADRWMEANALYRLEVLKHQATWPRQVKIPLWPTNEAFIDAVAAATIGDVVEIVGTPVGGSTQTWLCFIEHIVHDIDARARRWDVTLTLSSADAWLNAWGVIDDYVILDSSDEWDSGLKWAP